MNKEVACPDCKGTGIVPECCGRPATVCCGAPSSRGEECCGEPVQECCGSPDAVKCQRCQGAGEVLVDLPPGIPCSDGLFAAIAAEDDDLPF